MPVFMWTTFPIFISARCFTQLIYEQDEYPNSMKAPLLRKHLWTSLISGVFLISGSCWWHSHSSRYFSPLFFLSCKFKETTLFSIIQWIVNVNVTYLFNFELYLYNKNKLWSKAITIKWNITSVLFAYTLEEVLNMYYI